MNDITEHLCRYVSGYSTGSIIKQQKERQDYIDDFYASHSPSIVLALSAQAGDSNGTSAKLNNLSHLKKEQWSSRRTHSLQDVLSAKPKDETEESKHRPSSRSASATEMKGETEEGKHQPSSHGRTSSE